MDGPSGFNLSLFGLLVVAGVWASWWAKIKALTVPRNPLPYQVVMAVGGAVSIWGMLRGPGYVGGALVLIALVAAGLFLFFTSLSTPTKPPAVAIGERILPFSALDSDGNEVSIDSLIGDPFLLKFYRGHW